MNEQLKKYGLPMIVFMLTLIGYSYYIRIQDVGFAYTVCYDGDMKALLDVLDVYPDNTIVRIIFSVDAIAIPYSDKIVMSDIDSRWFIGDWLPLHKSDGIWHEMSRYIADKFAEQISPPENNTFRRWQS